MAFHEIRLHEKISYGARGGPGFNTAITGTDSGREERIQRWAQARRNWDVAYGIRNLDNGPQLILDFHLARAGAAHGFRFKDWADFSSAANKRDAPARTDQILGTGDGTTTTFQLQKRYTSGATTVVRAIQKPVAGSVLVDKDGVDQAGLFTVNTTNGIVTFTTAPGAGTALKAGFYFDVPARFGDDVDKQLPMVLAAFKAAQIPPLTIVELKDESVADEDYWFGSGTAFGTMTANIAITELDGRMLTFNPTVGGRVITLPNPATLEPGGPKAYLVNLNNTNALAVRNHLGAAIATLAPLGTIVTILGLNAASAKTWFAAVA